MKLILLLLLTTSAMGQKPVNFNDYPPFISPLPGYTVETARFLNNGRMQAMMWRDTAIKIDYKQHWLTDHFPDSVCFELNKNNVWKSCNCDLITIPLRKLRYKYQHNKRFQERENKKIRDALDRMEDDEYRKKAQKSLDSIQRIIDIKGYEKPLSNQ